MDWLKSILGLVLGGSKWPMIGLTLIFVGVGGYLFYQMHETDKALAIAKQNVEILTSNIDKLNKAKEEQDLTISRQKQLLLLANNAKDNMVKDVQKFITENDKLKRKLAIVTAKKALANPTDFENKVNATMDALNKCFQDLSNQPITGKQDETIICSVDSIPDFSK
jgi:hypothetical protein